MALAVAFIAPAPPSGPTAATRARARQSTAAAAAAQPAPCEATTERLALVVGVNEYEHVTKLQAPVQDVADMRDVLMKKFCFPAGNIKVLTDKEANHDRILSEFRSHLTARAKAYAEGGGRAKTDEGAVVLFYYSGHGSQVKDEEDGDETDDHLDETLVTVDSHGRDDKNFSVTDDEIYELSRELGAYTSNVTFIFDSCFSGSVTRGGESDDDEVPVKKVPTDTRKQPVRRVGPGSKPPDERDAGLMPQDKNYVLITAARSDELAGERIRGRRNSIMTHHLIRALEHATPETSYWQLWNELQRDVTSDKKTQHPQIEGDLTRSLFAGAASREDVFLAAEAEGAQAVTISAGAAHGVRKGALVALYRPEAKRITDLSNQLGTATITSVDETTATASLDQRFIVPKGARATIISPNFGSEKVRVRLDLGPAVRLTKDERETLARLSERLRNHAMLEAAPGPGGRPPRWHVAVLRGKFGELFKDESELAPPQKGEPPCPIPARDAEVFYIAVEAGKPIYGFFVQPTCQLRVEKILNALQKFAAQHDLRALGNDAWPRGEGLKISVRRVRGKFIDALGYGGSGSESVRLLRHQAAYTFMLNELLFFEVTNETDKELYVTVLALRTDGGIEILFPAGLNPKPIVRGEPAVTTSTGHYYETTSPPGYETIKVIATTKPADFRFLETNGVTREGGTARKKRSEVSWLLARAMGKQKEADADLPELGTWTTAEIQLSVGGRR